MGLSIASITDTMFDNEMVELEFPELRSYLDTFCFSTDLFIVTISILSILLLCNTFVQIAYGDLRKKYRFVRRLRLHLPSLQLVAEVFMLVVVFRFLLWPPQELQEHWVKHKICLFVWAFWFAGFCCGTRRNVMGYY